MIPIILSIVTASMFIATISNNKVFAFCSESSNENTTNIHCNENYNYNSNSDATTATTTPTITEEVEEEEPSPQDCTGLLCLGNGLLVPGLDSISDPLEDLGID